jgi:hypothetical protein
MLNGPDGCPAEDNSDLVLRVKKFERGDIMRQRKTGTIMERKWLRTEVPMTARAFMADFRLQYAAQAKREFMGRWQASEGRQMEEWCKTHLDGYSLQLDWLQNPEVKTHRELQSDHW